MLESVGAYGGVAVFSGMILYRRVTRDRTASSQVGVVTNLQVSPPTCQQGHSHKSFVLICTSLAPLVLPATTSLRTLTMLESVGAYGGVAVFLQVSPPTCQQGHSHKSFPLTTTTASKRATGAHLVPRSFAFSFSSRATVAVNRRGTLRSRRGAFAQSQAAPRAAKLAW
jgi:hypothetical protein